MAAYTFNNPNLTGTEIERRLEYVHYLELLYSNPIGFEFDTASGSPILKIIDANGHLFTPPPSFYDTWEITGNIRRCVRNRTTGIISYGINNRGDGLDLTGASGDVLVEIPTGKYKIVQSGTKLQFYVAPNSCNDPSYSAHPVALQRSNTQKSKIYVGAYEASIRDDAGVLKLQSVANTQPCTGASIKYLNFTNGLTAFTIGETITQGSAVGIVMDFHKSSGTWGTDANGTLYLRSVTGSFTTGALTGSSGGSATSSGSTATVGCNLTQLESYGNSIGSGFGICNVWTYAWIQLLMYLEYASLNLQSTLAPGITGGTAIRLTGSDSIDSPSMTTPNGTGIGNGVAISNTPFRWRGLENLWGNTGEFIIGINMFISAGDGPGSYRIIKRTGVNTPTLSETVTSGTYETGSSAVPLTNGYITGIQTDELGALTFMPSNVSGGSSLTYLCDQFLGPGYDPSTVVFGGSYAKGTAAGVSYRSATLHTGWDDATVGCRIEYIPQS